MTESRHNRKPTRPKATRQGSKHPKRLLIPERQSNKDHDLMQTQLFKLLFEELSGHIDAYIDTALDERLGRN